MLLKNRVALITGASRGIGRAIALRLAREGARVAINYRSRPEEAAEVLKAVEEMCQEGITIQADVSKEEDVVAMVNQVVERWGTIDILVNNAGVIKDRLLLRMTTEDWDYVLNTNLRGTYLCCRHVLKHMLRQQKGRIINVASVVGVVGNPGQTNYAASKAGIIAFTRSLAREVANRNITVNALAPGYIDTEIVERLPETTKQHILGLIPMGHFGTPEDVAGMAAFLCTDEARYITGSVIHIDGGITA